jgi:hypothetical protein
MFPQAIQVFREEVESLQVGKIAPVLLESAI